MMRLNTLTLGCLDELMRKPCVNNEAGGDRERGDGRWLCREVHAPVACPLTA